MNYNRQISYRYNPDIDYYSCIVYLYPELNPSLIYLSLDVDTIYLNNFPEELTPPTEEDFLRVNPIVKEQKEKERAKRQALDYLNSTNIYLLRQLENGTDMPQDIVDKRQDAWVIFNS